MGHFSDYVPRNLFFFPRDFENVRRNFISDGQNRGNLRENLEKLGENQEKAVNVKKSLRICARFVGRMILNPRRKHKFFPSLAEILTKNRSSF